MPVCSYVVVPSVGEAASVAAAMNALDGCEVVPAINSDVLLLVTETDNPSADAKLRERVEAVPGVQALLLSFGEIDPDTTEGDPVRRARGGRR